MGRFGGVQLEIVPSESTAVNLYKVEIPGQIPIHTDLSKHESMTPEQCSLRDGDIIGISVRDARNPTRNLRVKDLRGIEIDENGKARVKVRRHDFDICFQANTISLD